VEWALSPTNAVFLRVQTGVYDPSLVGDKSKWFSHLLAHKLFQVYDESSSLAAALEMQTSAGFTAADDNRTGLSSELLLGRPAIVLFCRCAVFFFLGCPTVLARSYFTVLSHTLFFYRISDLRL